MPTGEWLLIYLLITMCLEISQLFRAVYFFVCIGISPKSLVNVIKMLIWCKAPARKCRFRQDKHNGYLHYENITVNFQTKFEAEWGRKTKKMSEKFQFAQNNTVAMDILKSGWDILPSNGQHWWRFSNEYCSLQRTREWQWLLFCNILSNLIV